MSGRLESHVSIVTGGASGIGAAVVERFVGEGASIVVLDRDANRLDALGARLPVRTITADVTVPAENRRAVALALREFGRLDSVIANAGRFDFGRPMSAMSGEELAAGFAELFEVNTLAPLLLAQAAARSLVESRGAVVVTVSCAGLYAGGGGTLYVASKHAAVGAVRQMARELAPDVRVNAVAPGYTRTDLRGVDTWGTDDRSLADSRGADHRFANSPLQSLAEPEDHTDLYVALASRRETPHTTAAVIPSDGGLEVRWPGGQA